jgi:hypothetical protein
VREINIILQPGAVSRKFGQRAAIHYQRATHTKRCTSSDYLSTGFADSLAARSFANISYLAPGTEPVEPSDPTKARITAVATGGSSGLNNEVSVDGGDNSDDYIGGFLQNFSPDAIQEFAFKTAQTDADTGRTTAGSVVITTRSGTDDVARRWLLERAAALNARFPIDNPLPIPSSRLRDKITSARSAGRL